MFHIELFKETLDAQHFQFINTIEGPNAAYDEFIKIYSALLNKSFPFRESNSSRFLKQEPWFTSGPLTSSRTKAKVFSNKLTNPLLAKIYRNINPSIILLIH